MLPEKLMWLKKKSAAEIIRCAFQFGKGENYVV